MAREGMRPDDTRLHLEQIEEREEGVPPWSTSHDLQPVRRTPTAVEEEEGDRRGIEVDVEAALGEPSADEDDGSRRDARPLIENRDPRAVNKCLKVNLFLEAAAVHTHVRYTWFRPK